MRFSKPLLIALLGVLPAITARAETVTIKGSDTMVILVQRWAEEFMKKNPDAQLQVTGGGSGVGISALINGTTDICMSSRAIKAPEKEKIRARYSTTGSEYAVAKDGLAVYVNASNPVAELSLAQVKDVFLGKITNWKELGGPDAGIIVYSRENSSGTYVYFKDKVLGGRDFTPRAQTVPGTASVVNAVSKEKFGIGYGGAAYAKGIKITKLKGEAGAAVEPNEATVRAGSYPLARPLFLYTRTKPSGTAKAFIDWTLSPEGQGIVTKVGYFPLQ